MHFYHDILAYMTHVTYSTSAWQCHYSDVIMGMMASQITSLTIVYTTVYSGADQRKHQSTASLAFVRGIHLWPVNSPHKWSVTWNMFPFDDVIISASNGRSPTRSMRIELAVSELEINVRRSMCELENMGIGRIGSLKQSLKPKIRCVYTKTNPCYRPANGLVPDMASILCMFSVRTPADSTDGDREFPQYIVFYRRG